MASDDKAVSFASYAKGKRKILSMAEKLKVIEAHEKGVSRTQLMAQYDLKRSTLHDILKGKERVREVMKKIEGGRKGRDVYRSRKFEHENLDDAVYKQYMQERAKGLPVRSVDIKRAAQRLSTHLGISNFKCSDGWLWRFRRRHGIVNRVITGELLSADAGAVEPFVEKLLKLIEEEGLHEFQIYSADETGLFWRTLPKNIEGSIDIGSTSGYKTIKERLSILVCANADGSHRLKPMVVGKNRKPRALKDMTILPVEYHETASAWFNQEITTNWFHRSFDPSVRHHQTKYGIKPEDVKALLLLDIAPSHPAASKLCSKDGRIKTMFLPPNTTSIIQPMDQGVIESVKRHYRNLYLQQCLVVVEDGMDEPDYVDTRRRKTMENFNDYKIKDALFNLAEAWQQVPLATLRHAWCKLLKTPKVSSLGRKEFEGLEIPRIVKMLQEAGQGEIQPEELVEWAEEDFGVPGYHHLTEEEIANSVQGGETTAEEKEEDEKERTAQGPSLAAGLESIATCLSLIDRVGKPLANHYEGLRILRNQVIQLQQAKLEVSFEV